MSATSDAHGRVVRKIRARAVLFLAAALVAGIAAVFLVKVYLDQARQRSTTAPIATVSVVVAATPIQGGKRLDVEQLAVRRWPAAHAPAGTFQRIEDVVGQTPRQSLVAGEPVLQERLANKARGQGLAAILDAGARAMAVKVDQVVGIAGFVQPGDRVDVITTLATDEETRAALASKAAKMSKIILQDIRVLAVGEHLATEGQKPVKVQVVTLEVQPEQSERLALASLHGSIQLTMRSRIDRETVPTDGVTPLSLLGDGRIVPARTSPAAAREEPRVKTTRRPPRTRERVVEPPPPPPLQQRAAIQVIEILRGTAKVEERKLKPVGATP